MVSLTLISQPGNVALALSPCEFVFNLSGVGTSVDIKLKLTTTLGDGAVYYQSCCPDEDGNIYFDISSLLQTSPVPSFTQGATSITAVAHPSTINTYSVEWAITGLSSTEYTDDTTYSNSTISSLYYIQGMISEDDQAYLSDKGTNWWEFFSDNQLFLNMMPKDMPKLVHPEQTERLYWIALRTETEILQIHWKSTDGRTGTITKSIAMIENVMYELIVSPALVQAQLGSSILMSYMVDIDGFLGEQYYQLDYNNYREHTFFLFMNSYGAWETLWAKGQHLTSHLHQRTSVELGKSGIASPLTHQFSNREYNLSRTGTVNTGNLSCNEWALWSDGILSSELVYILDDDTYYPIVIDTDEIVVGQRPAFKFLNFDIEYTYSKASKAPNRLFTHDSEIHISTLEDDSVLTTEDEKIIVLNM